MAQMKLPAVLKLVHKLPHDATAPITGNRRVEIKAAMRTVCTGEIAGDRTGKLFRTFFAKRRFDARCFLLAFCTEIFSGVDVGRTNDAERRIKE